MAHYLHQVAGEEVMATLWDNLLDAPRRALCQLAYIDPLVGHQSDWKKIPVAQRVDLVRAMRAMAEISVDCAVAMQLARDALERAAPPTPREQMVNGIAKIIGLPADQLDRHWTKKK